MYLSNRNNPQGLLYLGMSRCYKQTTLFASVSLKQTFMVTLMYHFSLYREGLKNDPETYQWNGSDAEGVCYQLSRQKDASEYMSFCSIFHMAEVPVPGRLSQCVQLPILTNTSLGFPK